MIKIDHNWSTYLSLGDWSIKLIKHDQVRDWTRKSRRRSSVIVIWRKMCRYGNIGWINLQFPRDVEAILQQTAKWLAYISGGQTATPESRTSQFCGCWNGMLGWYICKDARQRVWKSVANGGWIYKYVGLLLVQKCCIMMYDNDW